jgi:phosphoenolpyruvate carboxylase
MDALLAEGGGAGAEEVYEALLRQRVDIVLTAHPTEVRGPDS